MSKATRIFPRKLRPITSLRAQPRHERTDLYSLASLYEREWASVSGPPTKIELSRPVSPPFA